jgi:signal transduction histidine kinase
MARRLILSLERFLPAPRSIQSRLFWLLATTSLSAVLAVNVIWLPGAIHEIQQGQQELQRVSAQAARDQIRHFTEGLEQSLKRAALLFHVALIEGDRQALPDIAQRLLQEEPAFEEVAVLDADGKQIVRASRRFATNEGEPGRFVLPSFAADTRPGEPHWGPVIISETSEPWAPLAVRRASSKPRAKDGVYTLVNLKRLLHVAEDFRLSKEGRLYVVGRNARLIAAADPSLVLKQLSLADRAVVRSVAFARSIYEPTFVHGRYTNELGVAVEATGVRLNPPGWGVIVEQPRSLLYAMVWQKVWFFIGLSFAGLVAALVLGHFASRRFTAPITRLRRGVEQIGAGQLSHRVLIETNDEIGELAMQFNRMAGALDASYHGLEDKIAERTRELSSVYTAMTPLAGRSTLQELFEGIIDVVMEATGSDAAAIRSADPDTSSFTTCLAQQGLPGENERGIGGKGSAIEQVFTSGEPIISPDIRLDPRISKKNQLEFGYQSCAFLPFLVNGQTRGIIHLASKRLGYFSEEKNEYLMTIARLMGIVVENHELMQSSVKYAEELSRSNRELEQSNRELEQFAYVASHDLQEPLRMVSGYTQLLSQRYKDKLGADAAEFIGFAVDGAKRMHGLINDLLAYSRFGNKNTEFARTDCEVVLQRALKNLQTAATETHALITHSPLPILTADAQQLAQLFQNLIGNGLKYHGAQPPAVHIGCEQKGSTWLFSVKDNGIGIDPQYRERIFVIFQRLHTREQYPGTGIGLAICKKIVERHGGRIWVDSELGKGSTFYFTIPAQLGGSAEAGNGGVTGAKGPANDIARS